MTAFVEVRYASDHASFGGAACGTVQRAEIVEVEAETEGEAVTKAREKIHDDYTFIHSATFRRWS